MLSRLALCLDERLDNLDTIFTEDVHGRIGDGEPFTSREEMRTNAGRNLELFERFQHLTTDTIVRLDGGTAHVRANLLAFHLPRADEPTRHADFGGYFDIDTVRHPDGWRISRVVLHQTWIGGDPTILESWQGTHGSDGTGIAPGSGRP